LNKLIEEDKTSSGKQRQRKSPAYSPQHSPEHNSSDSSDEDWEQQEIDEQERKEEEYLGKHKQRNASPERSIAQQHFDISSVKSHPHQPVPEHAGQIQCFIKREKGVSKLYPTYTMYLEAKERGGDTEFLFLGKKMARNKTPNYRVFTSIGDTSKSSPSFVGKLRGSFMGREYQMLDTCESDRDRYSKQCKKKQTETGSVFYELDDSGICDMEIVVPRTEDHTDYKPKGKNPPIILINKSPRLNSAIGKFVLNFKGRVTCASVKNFQLLDKKNKDLSAIKYQFGKVGKDKFVCDFAYPLSPFQAFSIALSKFDSRESN